MFRIYRTVEGATVPRTDETGRFEPGAWVSLVNPTADEIREAAEKLSIPGDYIRAALDEEERPRTESEDGVTLIIIDIPMPYPEQTILYTTMPLGIIVTPDVIVTVCLRENAIIEDFSNGRVKPSTPRKKPGSCSRSSFGTHLTSSSTCARSSGYRIGSEPS